MASAVRSMQYSTRYTPVEFSNATRASVNPKTVKSDFIRAIGELEFFGDFYLFRGLKSIGQSI